jgi:Tol biopolymer transport system component
VKLTGLPFDVLVLLISNQNRMLSKKEIFDAVWRNRPDTVFDVNLIDRAISTIRAALGNDSSSTYLRVERGKGIIFDAVVTGETPAKPQRGHDPWWVAAAPWVLAATFGVLALTTAWLVRGSGPQVAMDPRPLTTSGNPKFGPLVILENPHRVLFTELVDGHYQVSWVESATRRTGTLRTDIANPTVVAASPDGKELLLRDIVTGIQDDGPLLMQAPENGTARKLGITGYDGVWAPDGRWMAVTRGGAIVRYIPGSGQAEELFRDSGSGYAYWPRFSPNGRSLRFTMLDGNPQVNSLWKLDPGSREARRISPVNADWATAGAGAWSFDGRDFFFHCGQGSGAYTLWWMPGASEPTPASRPRRLTTGPISFRTPQADPVTRSLYAKGQFTRTEMAQISLEDGSSKVLLPDTLAAAASYSRDGQRLVYYTTNPEEALWLSTAAGTERQLLVGRPVQSSMPQWSPDGKRIALSTRRPGNAWRLTVISAEDRSQEEIPTLDRNVISPTWTPDGREILFGTIPTVEKDPAKVAVYRVDLETKKTSAVAGTQGLYMPALSPNGRYLGAITAEGNHIRVLDLAQNRWLRATERRAPFLAWAKDSSGVLFVSGRQGGVAIERCKVPDMETTVARVIPEFKPFGFWIGVAADGALLMPRDLSTQEIYQLAVR